MRKLRLRNIEAHRDSVTCQNLLGSKSEIQTQVCLTQGRPVRKVTQERLIHAHGWTHSPGAGVLGPAHSPVGDTVAMAGSCIWGAAGGAGEAGGALATQGLQVPGWQARPKALHLNHVASI